METEIMSERGHELKHGLAMQFPDGYWNSFKESFGHDFFEVHIERTIEYDEILSGYLIGKRVLEVGGFPGLETAWLLNIGCKVDCIDSPDWNPEYYKEWIDSTPVNQIINNIVDGPPGLSKNYEVAIMSDVLLHINGFPIDFVEWLIRHSGVIIMINYSNGSGNVFKATGHDLKNGFSILPTQKLIETLEKLGAKFEEEIKLKSERTALIFQGLA